MRARAADSGWRGTSASSSANWAVWVAPLPVLSYRSRHRGSCFNVSPRTLVLLRELGCGSRRQRATLQSVSARASLGVRADLLVASLDKGRAELMAEGRGHLWSTEFPPNFLRNSEEIRTDHKCNPSPTINAINRFHR